MKHTHDAGCRHGLTPLQLVLLFIAFMIGLGGTFVLREVILSTSAHAGVIQTVSVHGSVR